MNPATASVLVVDDIEENRDILVRRLGRLGIGTIKQATNGVEALAAIDAGNFDLVLLDIMMPEMDGFEVLKRLGDRGMLTDLPVIVISALSEMEPVVRCIEMGAEDFLLKPFNPTLLRARILAILEKKRLRDRVRDDLHRKEAELRHARTLQQAMAPESYRANHHGRRIEIDAVLDPAKEVGGDLVDLFPVGDDLIVVLLGDVSGKGAGAALMMARTQALFRGLMSRPDAGELFAAPERAADLVNKVLSKGNSSCMFVTLALAVVDVRENRLRCVRAGHVAPYLARADGTVERLMCDNDTPLGLMESKELGYRSTGFDLRRNDHLLLITDGVTEANSPEDEWFGEERVAELLAASADDTLLSRLVARVRQFENGLPPSDDVAALHLRYDIS